VLPSDIIKETDMKVSLVVKHDFLTLTVRATDERRLNMTMGRSGEKVTASGEWSKTQFEPPARAFMNYVKENYGTKNPGEIMAALKVAAVRAKSIEDFTTIVSGL
jgi:hypothetical protein